MKMKTYKTLSVKKFHRMRIQKDKQILKPREISLWAEVSNARCCDRVANGQSGPNTLKNKIRFIKPTLISLSLQKGSSTSKTSSLFPQ